MTVPVVLQQAIMEQLMKASHDPINSLLVRLLLEFATQQAGDHANTARQFQQPQPNGQMSHVDSQPAESSSSRHSSPRSSTPTPSPSPDSRHSTPDPRPSTSTSSARAKRGSISSEIEPVTLLKLMSFMKVKARIENLQHSGSIDE